MIIGVSLGILVIITIFSIILGGSDVISASFESKWASVQSIGTIVQQKFTDITFELDELDGLFVVLGVLIAFVLLLGITVLASGLSQATIKMIAVMTAYGGIWLVLTSLAIDLIKSIEIFGSLIYISLTIAYVVGIVQKHIGV